MSAYKLLGLARGASAHEVKKAFRRLAMRWHPDRNADPAALEHFKALRAAYETLLAELTAVTEAPRDARPRGANRWQDITLTLEEAFCGGDTTVELGQESECPACDGSGEEVLKHTRLCEQCHGTGRMRGKHGLVRCALCDGRGYVSRQVCATCTGTGRQRSVHPLAVTLPAGLVAGDEVRVAGAGEACELAHGVPGDLILRIHLAPHALYRLDGRDLILSRPLSALRMLLGGELAIPMPDGLRTIKLAPGKATARDLRVAGAGLPGRNGQPAGNLIVQLLPTWPEAPDAAMRALLEQLDTLVAADHSRHLPDVALWEARWLDDACDAPGAP